MKNILEVLKQRRIWATLCAMLSITLRASGSDVEVNEEGITNAIMALIQAIADLGMVLLPLWSYVNPKKNVKKNS